MKNRNMNSRTRRIIGDILLVLVVLLTADVIFVMSARINAVVLKADYQEVFMYEIILCVILLLFALDVRLNLFTRWKPVLLKGIGWVLRAVIVLLSAVILFFCGKVIVGGMISTASQADSAIVLGLALENGKPAPDLLARLDTARTYLDKYPEAQLILTGGNADESGRTEAAVMHDLLTEQGVPESRLILEDRAVRNASEEGFTHVMRLPAPSGFFAYGANMLSEVVLDLNDLVK